MPPVPMVDIYSPLQHSTGSRFKDERFSGPLASLEYGFFLPLPDPPSLINNEDAGEILEDGF